MEFKSAVGLEGLTRPGRREREPEVFCLDEPTANLDPENSEIIEQIIFSMKTAAKSTIIVVTHDPAPARRLGDQRLVMENGRIAPL
jgi:ABC-type multidrug transport system ATPase subunit